MATSYAVLTQWLFTGLEIQRLQNPVPQEFEFVCLFVYACLFYLSIILWNKYYHIFSFLSMSGCFPECYKSCFAAFCHCRSSRHRCHVPILLSMDPRYKSWHVCLLVSYFFSGCHKRCCAVLCHSRSSRHRRHVPILSSLVPRHVRFMHQSYSR